MDAKNYLNQKIWRDKAQDMTDCGMVNKSIKKLGQPTSNAFQIHFAILSENLYNLIINF